MKELEELLSLIESPAFSLLKEETQEEIRKQVMALQEKDAAQKKKVLIDALSEVVSPALKEYAQDISLKLDYNAERGELIICESAEVKSAPADVVEDDTPDENVQVNSYAVTEIADNEYKGNRDITMVDIPDTVTRIGMYAFMNCEGLKSIDIPKSVIGIGHFAFFGCTRLKSFNVSEDNNVYISKDGVLYSKNMQQLVAFPSAKDISDFTVPDSVTTICEGAFGACGNLVSIKFPNTLRSIGNGSFNGCYNLAAISIPDSIRSIGAIAFKGCSNLRKVEIPSSVTELRERVFFGCDKIEDLYCRKENPGQVMSNTFSYNVFDTCTLHVPKNAIKRYKEHPIFMKFKNIVPIVEGSMVKYSDDGRTLIDASGIERHFTVPGTVKVIGEGAFRNCTKLQSISIPDSVADIGARAFEGTRLTQVKLPNSLQRLGDAAFKKTGLRSISIPDSLLWIGDNAFSGCTQLKEVFIPDARIKIGSSVFSSCVNLTTIHCKISNIKEVADIIDKNAFQNVRKGVRLLVPSGTELDYRNCRIFGGTAICEE